LAITREPIAFTAEGLRLLVPRSKGNAAGEGVSIGIARGSIDAVLAECVAVLEVRAAQHRDERARSVIQDCADALLAVQFGGPVPIPARR
jgi:hypothetical protein